MSNKFTIPTSRPLELAKIIANDASSKVFDLPSIFFQAVVVAVYNVALYDTLTAEDMWRKVYNSVDSYLEQLFHNVTLFDDDDNVLAVDEDFPMTFYNIDEMEAIIKHLTEAILDGLAEYDLESSDDWLKLVDMLKKDIRLIRRSFDLFEADIRLRLSRKTLIIDTSYSVRHKPILELI